MTGVESDELTRLAETTRLIRLGRRVVRQVAAAPDASAAADRMSELLCEAFGAVGLRLRLVDSSRPERVYGAPGRSVLLMPIDAGEECLGTVALLRGAGAPVWSTTEHDAALEIGRDLGRLLRRRQARDRERQLIRELSALDDHHDGLIQTIGSGLQDPLDLIRRRLGPLASEHALDDHAVLVEVHRTARRMVRVVDELLLRARLAHPDHRRERGDVGPGGTVAG